MLSKLNFYKDILFRHNIHTSKRLVRRNFTFFIFFSYFCKSTNLFPDYET